MSERERPILLSGRMVRAVMSGRKTERRRVIKPQPLHILDWCQKDGRRGWCDPGVGKEYPWHSLSDCPYGRRGDFLWVRETWCPLQNIQACAVAGDPVTVAYKADWDKDEPDREIQRDMGIDKWRPSIFMPRWASRLTLRITWVWNEQLLDITEGDAKAEGFGSATDFLAYWDTLQKGGEYASDKNPWVWIIRFAVEGPPDGEIVESTGG